MKSAIDKGKGRCRRKEKGKEVRNKRKKGKLELKRMKKSSKKVRERVIGKDWVGG